MANTTVREITVNKDELVKAVEFAVSSGFSRKESWMYFDGVYCMDFFHADEKPSQDFTEGYNDYLDLCGLDDSDEAFTAHITETKDYVKSIMVENVLVLNSDEEIEEEIKVTYI